MRVDLNESLVASIQGKVLVGAESGGQQGGQVCTVKRIGEHQACCIQESKRRPVACILSVAEGVRRSEA